MTKFTAVIAALVPLAPVAVSALVPGSGADAVDTVQATDVLDVERAVSDRSIPTTIATSTPTSIPASIEVASPASASVAVTPQGGQSPATARDRQVDAPSSTIDDPFAPISSPDVGDHCASGLDAAAITEFFSQPIGSFQGADYQRALRLADDRVLWTFQDAFVSGHAGAQRRHDPIRQVLHAAQRWSEVVVAR